ncbi:MAG: RNA-guided pseudouridylation complex pseudouridine synthase subunit Cbf5 [Thermoplasmata archaeon]
MSASSGSEPSGGAFPAEVDGRITHGAFLLLDKPRGPSSHQVTAWAREIVGVDKAGHAGTLDPNVSGLLWVGLGPALKLLPLLLDFPKEYVAVITLHGSAPTKEVERVVGEFVGPIYQLPPVRSAVRRERRIRTVHRLTLVERDPTHLLLDVVADSGTYVRTLAVDLGEALGVGAHMEELRRIGTGPFTEAQSVPLTTLADAAMRARSGSSAALLELLHPLHEVVREFPSLVLKEGAASAIVHGANLASGGVRSVTRPFPKGAHVALLAASGDFLGFGSALVPSDEFHAHRHGWVVRCERVLARPTDYPPAWRGPKTTAAAGSKEAPGERP